MNDTSAKLAQNVMRKIATPMATPRKVIEETNCESDSM
jgi:hypothetical protein